jgi:phosphate acetyltransferase
MNAPEPRQHEKYDRLIARCRGLAPVPTAVAHPCDEFSLSGAIDAAEARIILPLLVGPEAKIRAAAEKQKLDLSRYEIVDAPHSHAAAEKAVELVRLGKAELLMKGSLHTDELMGAVVHKESGLRTERRISHVFIMDVPSYHKPLFVTDAAINIFPSLDDKVDILKNAIELAQALEIKKPKVAILSAVETVNSKNPFDDRRCRFVQNGRQRTDHGGGARRTARLRQRDQPRGRGG